MQVIVGVDCATQSEKVGLALADFDGHSLRILECRTASRREPPAQIIHQWLTGRGRALLALDAPLGWTEAFPRVLARHRAGRTLGTASANELFRRLTDDEIHRRLHKRPLEIGADRISRTAVAALRLLDELRARLGHPVPLAWAGRESARVRAIEVYPAATRIAHSVPPRGAALEDYGADISCSSGCRTLTDGDAKDAAICTIAGFDFLMNRCVAPLPNQRRRARTEGWIWVPEMRSRS